MFPGFREKKPSAAKYLRLYSPHFLTALQDVATELKRLEIAKKCHDNIGSISFSTLLTEAKYLKPFSIAILLMFFQQFCGVNVIMFYTQTIFQKAGSSLDPGTADQ